MPVDTETRYLVLAQIAAPIYAQRLREPGTDSDAMDKAINEATELVVRCGARVINEFGFDPR